MLTGIFVDQTICATGGDCSSQNAFAFLASPVTGLFALFKGFNGTGCQGCASGLCDALLTLVTFATVAVAAAAAAAAGIRWRAGIRSIAMAGTGAVAPTVSVASRCGTTQA
jgi:hypothetical protein